MRSFLVSIEKGYDTHFAERPQDPDGRSVPFAHGYVWQGEREREQRRELHDERDHQEPADPERQEQHPGDEGPDELRAEVGG